MMGCPEVGDVVWVPTKMNGSDQWTPMRGVVRAEVKQEGGQHAFRLVGEPDGDLFPCASLCKTKLRAIALIAIYGGNA